MKTKSTNRRSGKKSKSAPNPKSTEPKARDISKLSFDDFVKRLIRLSPQDKGESED